MPIGGEVRENCGQPSSELPEEMQCVLQSNQLLFASKMANIQGTMCTYLVHLCKQQ